MNQRLKRIAAMAIAILSIEFGACRARPSVLGAEMQRLGVRSALVVASQSIDEHPVWSPDGRYLAVNVDGRWSRIDLASIHLVGATWRKDQPVGAPEPPADMSRIGESRVRNWQRSARFEPRRIVTRDGTTVELKLEELGTAFIITKKGGQPETLWTSGLENCYGLALTPDEKSVAYICEQNGVLVTRL
jgi:hypothetical protein